MTVLGLCNGDLILRPKRKNEKIDFVLNFLTNKPTELAASNLRLKLKLFCCYCMNKFSYTAGNVS